MDVKSLSEQEKDIRDLLRRAERTPVKTSALRRDTLKRLIDLAHSPHASLKIIAATNLKLFIKDFPELEDDAINAVYDLCEDTVSSVRIKGYAAIVDVSREQNKWVKRNADVLVQLLQSDEPEEVTVVKRALTQHLDMDPVVTLGVLCDQVVPSDEPLDDEEQSIRDRLRSLVLAFLAGEAKRPLVERHANTVGSPAEQTLVSGLFKAITKLLPADVEIIVKDILAALPTFKSPAPRGKELLDIILTQIRAALKIDLPSGAENASLTTSRHYLDLALFVAVEKRLAPPSDLLRFFYASLTPKLVLVRLCEEDQAYVISGVARTVAASEGVGSRNPPTAPAADLGKTPGNASAAGEDAILRKQFPDICAVLLQVFSDMKSDEHRPWLACQTLVQGIVRRKRDTRWQIPQHVISAFRRLESLTAPQEASAGTKAAQEQVHSVIRSLLEPVKPPAASATQTQTSTSPSKTGAGDGQQQQKGNVKTTNGATIGSAHTVNGSIAGKGDQRRIMNVNKRKLDAGNGPEGAAPSAGPSGSRTPALPVSPGRPVSLPPRPSAATVASAAAGISGAPNAPRAERQRDRQAPPHIKGKAARSSPSTPGAAATAGPSSNGTPAGGHAEPESPRSAKRSRTDGGRGQNGSGEARSASVSRSASQRAGRGADPPVVAKVEEARPVPSLLSRLGGGPTNGQATAATSATPERSGQGQGRRNKREREEGDLAKSMTMPAIPAKRRANSTSHSAPSSVAQSASAPPRSDGRSRQPGFVDPDKDPVGGYSIRGAAKAASKGTSGSEGSGGKGPGSLLERMQAQSDGGEQGSDGAGRRRKRTKHT